MIIPHGSPCKDRPSGFKPSKPQMYVIDSTQIGHYIRKLIIHSIAICALVYYIVIGVISVPPFL
jgi:hypothetical protein